MEEKVSYIRKLRVTVDYCGLIATIMLIATIALTDSHKHRAATIPKLCKGDENSCYRRKISKERKCNEFLQRLSRLFAYGCIIRIAKRASCLA